MAFGSLLITWINFALVSLAVLGHFHTFPGVGWWEWGKIEIKDHLSPAEAEIGAELGNKRNQLKS